MKNFCYLILSQGKLPEYYKYLKNEDSDVYVSFFKDGYTSENWFSFKYHQNSTWAEARNLLLKDVLLENKSDYLYYIFMDDDLIFKPQDEIPALQDFLLKDKPSIAYPHINYKTKNDNKSQSKYNCDSAFFIIRKDCIKSVLPYYTAYQDKSWYYCQSIINIIQSIVYGKNRIQINFLTYENSKTNSYLQRETNWYYITEQTKSFLKDKYKSMVINIGVEDIDNESEIENKNVVREDSDYYIFIKKYWDDIENELSKNKK
jgi:hypothetical protein